MATYVTSLDARARLAHIGHPVTACGVVFVGAHRKSANMPNDRTICRECVAVATGYGWITRDEADVLLRFQPAPTDLLLPLLIAGHTDREIALRLGVSMRTISRRVQAAMQEAGARTRFAWGYRAGLATASD
jgi:hypothetical protein